MKNISMLLRQPFTFLLVATGFLWLACFQNVHSQELMSADDASRLGLTQAWLGAIRSPMGSQSISDLQLHVHKTKPHEYLEIIYTPSSTAPPKSAATKTGKPTAKKVDSPSTANVAASLEPRVLQRIWVNQNDHAGQAIGKKEAHRLAANQIRRLKSRGISATIRELVVPRVHLYSISSFGALECRNAEDGSLVWSTRVGDRHLNYRQLGVDDERVTVINGSNLILIDVMTGEVIDEEPLRHVPIFGAVNSGKYAMVATLQGPIESYDLANFDRRPAYESARGRAITAPIRSPVSSKVGWTTDAGFFYAMELDGNPSILFRLGTDGIVAGRPAVASGDRFFFGSDTGQVYAVRATRLGEVLWSMPFGEPFAAQPLLSGDSLFLPSVYGNLFAMNAKTGDAMWRRPAMGIHEVVCVLGDNLFVIMTNGNLAVVNKSTGQRTQQLNVQPARFVLNHKTNRFYLINERGLIQCLRPEDAELPTFNVQVEMTLDKTGKVAKTDEESEGQPDTSSNPFGAGDDTMDGDSDPFGEDGNDDPFGAGDEDPFGASDEDDPFGASDEDDPFG